MHKTTFQLEAEIAALTAERAKLMQDVDAALNLQDHAQRAEAEALERVAELESSLAARATPAQPTEKPLAWLATDLDGHGDVAFTQEEAKRRAGESCTYFYPLYDTDKPQPSPSSVGAAIRALPLPDTELTTKIGMFEVRAWTKSHIGDILHAAAEIAEKAMPQKSSVEKMLEINQLDELGHEVARLQRALCFWLPRVVDCDGEVAERIFQDAFLLDGIDGNIPDDFKTAQELGWITLSEAAALAEQVQGQQITQDGLDVPSAQ